MLYWRALRSVEKSEQFFLCVFLNFNVLLLMYLDENRMGFGKIGLYFLFLGSLWPANDQNDGERSKIVTLIKHACLQKLICCHAQPPTSMNAPTPHSFQKEIIHIRTRTHILIHCRLLTSGRMVATSPHEKNSRKITTVTCVTEGIPMACHP